MAVEEIKKTTRTSARMELKQELKKELLEEIQNELSHMELGNVRHAVLDISNDLGELREEVGELKEELKEDKEQETSTSTVDVVKLLKMVIELAGEVQELKQEIQSIKDMDILLGHEEQKQETQVVQEQEIWQDIKQVACAVQEQVKWTKQDELQYVMSYWG